jgi:phosphoadenosine phosphosulfate reductase
MGEIMSFNLDTTNNELRDKTPHEIIQWAIAKAKKPIVTTNFGPYSASILDAVTKVKKDIDVVWIDTGYNTQNTYNYSKFITEKLSLNIHLYVPKQTAAYRDVTLGIPSVDDPKHKIFTEQVKLEPFKRAMIEHKPDVWFTNLRKGQTTFRDSIDIVSQGANGILKVSPFYYWTDEDLDTYLLENNLPNEFKYFDPTKQLENRECGLHA